MSIPFISLHSLNSEKYELKYKVYSAQKIFPVQGDWIGLLAKDKKEFGIDMSDAEVVKISEEKIKGYIKQKNSGANHKIP